MLKFPILNVQWIVNEIICEEEKRVLNLPFFKFFSKSELTGSLLEYD